MGVSLTTDNQDHPQFHIPTYDKDVELEPNYFCRARNVKREKYCRARSGQGTDHLGQGRCRNHGGCTPIKSGRYSEVVRDALGEHLERLELEDERDQLDIMPEAMFLRGIVMDTSENWTKFRSAIIAWNEAEESDAAEAKQRPKFLALPELKDLGDIAKKTAEIVNMIHKQKAQNAIGYSDFMRLMASMAETVNSVIDKALDRYVNAGIIDQDVIDNTKNEIQKEWRSIKVKK